MLSAVRALFIKRAHARRFIQTSRRLKGFDAPTVRVDTPILLNLHSVIQVWHEFTPLALKHKSVNLGQGFPDWETPSFVKNSMIDAINKDHNQYCRSGGEINLVEALAKFYSPLVGREINPLTEITTSVGATEAIFALTQAVINEGDEVIVLEPAFDK